MSAAFEPTAQIKLVIWDLDDTFWSGTLSEGAIALVEENASIVRALADRGIVSSICSKNEPEAVREVLTEAGLWDYFVFPRVAFAAKGQAILGIIEQANLRPDNVLFIDDNPLNLEEVKFLAPSIMVGTPQRVLPVLLDLPEAKGKDDRLHSRLSQYKALELKANDFANTKLDNASFLKECDINIRFDYDVEKHLTRVFELINRSNQLNFTKSRVEADQELTDFRSKLANHDVMSAAVFVSDKYGQHGLSGFYMAQKNENDNRLIHFVFSCRIMNMGIEQYIYERLGNPNIDIVGPVSNPICAYESVDWVTEVFDKGEDAGLNLSDRKVVLLGSCDLTAVATYCSADRAEYVNAVRDSIMIRYDDFGFLLNDQSSIDKSLDVEALPVWTKTDVGHFRTDIATADIVILSLSAAMTGSYFLTNDNVVARVHPAGLGNYIDDHPFYKFKENGKVYSVSLTENVRLLEQSVARIEREAANAKHIFLLGANTRDKVGTLSASEREALLAYNSVARDICERNGGWCYVSIDDLVAEDQLVDNVHYTRLGYFEIARHILDRAAEPSARRDAPERSTENWPGIADVVRRGRRRRWFDLVGQRHGLVGQAKRVASVLRLSGFLRKMIGTPDRDSRRVLAFN